MSDLELGLALVGLVLAFLLGRVRRARIARSILSHWKSSEIVTFQDMNDFVAELRPTLTEQVMVPSSAASLDLPIADRGYIWNTPSGKRVYMN